MALSASDARALTWAKGKMLAAGIHEAYLEARFTRRLGLTKVGGDEERGFGSQSSADMKGVQGSDRRALYGRDGPPYRLVGYRYDFDRRDIAAQSFF